MGDKTLRFAAGSPKEPFSAVWRLVGGKDAFLGCYRQGMGLLKISLHPNDTTFGFTSQSGTKFENGSRIDKAWPRPPEFHPGWTQGPWIVVPRTSIGARALLDENLSGSIAWVPAPQEGETVFFFVLLEKPGGAQDSGILRPGDVVLGSVVERRFGGVVWVIAGRYPTPVDLQHTCESQLADPRNQIEWRPIPNPPAGTFLLILRSDIQPLVIDLPAPIR